MYIGFFLLLCLFYSKSIWKPSRLQLDCSKVDYVIQKYPFTAHTQRKTKIKEIRRIERRKNKL